MLAADASRLIRNVLSARTDQLRTLREYFLCRPIPPASSDPQTGPEQYRRFEKISYLFFIHKYTLIIMINNVTINTNINLEYLNI